MHSRPSEERPISHVKLLREIRDRMGKEMKHMTPEEERQWLKIKNPMLRDLLAGAKKTKIPPPKHAVDNEELLRRAAELRAKWLSEEPKPRRGYVDATVLRGCVEGKFIEASRWLYDAFVNGDYILIMSDCVLEALDDDPGEVWDLLRQIPDSHTEFVVTTETAEELVDAYVDAGAVPESARPHARHYALATLVNADVLVSWDHRNVCNFFRYGACNDVNLARGHERLSVRTPRALGLQVPYDPDDLASFKPRQGPPLAPRPGQRTLAEVLASRAG